MISEDAIRKIISLYEKHGWQPRRVLLSDKLRGSLIAHYRSPRVSKGDDASFGKGTDDSGSALADPALTDIFGPVEIIPSDLNAVWFSRSSEPAKTAWELRRLSALPYALVEIVDIDIQPADLEAVLALTENTMREKTSEPFQFHRSL
jgi:hypothetical protein